MIWRNSKLQILKIQLLAIHVMVVTYLFVAVPDGLSVEFAGVFGKFLGLPD